MNADNAREEILELASVIVGTAEDARIDQGKARELATLIRRLDEWLVSNGMFPLAWLPPESYDGRGTAQRSKR